MYMFVYKKSVSGGSGRYRTGTRGCRKLNVGQKCVGDGESGRLKPISELEPMEFVKGLHIKI